MQLIISVKLSAVADPGFPVGGATLLARRQLTTQVLYGENERIGSRWVWAHAGGVPWICQ